MKIEIKIDCDNSLGLKEGEPTIEIGSFELYKNWPVQLRIKDTSGDEEEPTKPL